MDYSIPRNPILHRNAVEAVDLDGDEAGPARDVDAQALLLQQRREINVEAALRYVGLRIELITNQAIRLLLGLVEGIRIQRLVCHNVVLQQRFEVLLAVGGEEESVDLRAQLAEGPVRGREERAAGVRAVGDGFCKAGFREAEFQGGECAGEERDDGCGGWGWEEEGVDAVDYAVGAELWWGGLV